ncbi:uncharacterized protein [Ptychodera flava]|uniref:uncharacterized protein n=1 Tax=Ptychodera flava TaxID=63121 RepID=UPI003969BC67
MKLLPLFVICVLQTSIQGQSYVGDTMLGVNVDKSLVARSIGFGGAWRVIPNSCCVTRIAVKPDGSLLGVGEDGSLYSKTSPDVGGWELIENTCCVQDVSVMPDGSIIGVNDRRKLVYYEEDTLAWKQVRFANGVVRVEAHPDGRIIGVRQKGSLRIRNGIEGRWKFLRSKAFQADDVAIQPDGTILGIKAKECGVHVQKDDAKWGEELTDSRCVISLAAPGNSDVLVRPLTTKAPTVAPTVAPTFAPTEGPKKESDALIYGLDVDLKMYKKTSLDAPWVEVPQPNSIGVLSVAVMHDGTIVGAYIDLNLWTKEYEDAPWVGPVENSQYPGDLTVMPDGTLVSASFLFGFKYKKSLTEPWTFVETNRPMAYIAATPEGGLYGLDGSGSLYYRPSLEGEWSTVYYLRNEPPSKKVHAVAVLPDGTVLLMNRGERKFITKKEYDVYRSWVNAKEPSSLPEILTISAAKPPPFKS